MGEEGLGEYAREQIERARLERDEPAAIADFWNAVEEAERVRTLGILGTHELLHTLDRHEREVGVRHSDADLDLNTRATLQAMWERVESARIEIEHGHPYLNAQALLSLVSALDAMVEDLARSWRGSRVKPGVDDLVSKVKEQCPRRSRPCSPRTWQPWSRLSPTRSHAALWDVRSGCTAAAQTATSGCLRKSASLLPTTGLFLMAFVTAPNRGLHPTRRAHARRWPRRPAGDATSPNAPLSTWRACAREPR